MASDPVAEIMRYAVALHKGGRRGQAEQLYLFVLHIDPDHPDANHNIGLIQFQDRRQNPGLTHLRRAATSNQARPLHLMSYAQALQLCGRTDEAASLLKRAQLAAEGHRAVPPVTAARDRIETAGRYKEAIASQILPLENYVGLADAFRQSGDPLEAITLLRRGLELNPESAELHCHLGDMLTFCERYEEAIAAYGEAVSLKPDFADAHYRLGTLLAEHGRIGEGFQHLMRRAELVSGGGGERPAAAPPHKVKHDREQRDFLAGGKAPDGAPQVDQMFHLGDGERIPGPVINPVHAGDAVAAGWRENSPQLVVLDEFLTAEALNKLQAYCAESTIWKRLYDAGYIGAIPADGFACPLLAQLAEEISSTWPAIFGPHRFKYLGAFKYDSELSTGTNTHADLAAVNVNFYIAPDQANLDPDTGGMKIWDCSIETESEMRRLNGDERAMNDYLAHHAAKLIRIPHRTNRAVIFKSNLIHKTDDFRFREGYLNKRINISLLFGEFGSATK